MKIRKGVNGNEVEIKMKIRKNGYEVGVEMRKYVSGNECERGN